jgi:hypothetical protein
MHRARPQQITHAHEGPPTTVIRTLVFLGKNKVRYFLDRPRIMPPTNRNSVVSNEISLVMAAKSMLR